MFPNKQTASHLLEKSWARCSKKADNLKVDSKEATSLSNLFYEVSSRQDPLWHKHYLLLLNHKSRITAHVLQAAFKLNLLTKKSKHVGDKVK